MTFSKRYANNNSGAPKKPEKNKGRENSRQDGMTRFSQQASRLSVGTQKAPKPSFPWRFYLLLISSILLIIGLSITWYHRNQWLFPIKHIALQGHFERVEPMAIQAVVGHYARGSLLFFDKGGLQNQLQSLPWVNEVKIKRLWPSALVITLNERDPVARFGDSSLLDQQGQVFTPPDMKNMDKLPYIIGPVNRAGQLWQAYQVLNEIVKPASLSISRLEVTPRLSYTLMMDNGMVLYLGSNQVVDRLKIFVKVYMKTLASRASLIQYADMRYDSGMAVGWKADAANASSKTKAASKKG